MESHTAVQTAGEHFVLFRLHEQGMLATMAPPGSPTVDVLVLGSDEHIVATLYVKIRTRGADKGWTMSAKHEQIRAPRCFYAFVDREVPKGMMPVTYIIPSTEVANMLAASHAAWLAIPNHRDRPVRRVRPTHPFKVPGYPDGWMEQYREGWSRLKAAVEQAPQPLNNGEFGGTTYAPALLPAPPGT